MTTETTIPSTVRVWEMHRTVESLSDVQDVQGSLKLMEKAAPSKLESGQVLVQVACVTINHEDLLHVQNQYINSKSIAMPRRVGFEASGIIVDSSQAPWYLGLKKGTRVALYAEKADALSDYVVCDAMAVIPIPAPKAKDQIVSYGVAAAAVQNPLTVILMVDKVYRLGHKVVVNTVGAGALGRLFTKYAKSLGIEVICFVRRDAQAEICVQDGAKYVLNMTSYNFDTKFEAIIKETKCTFAYDGLGGDMPNRLFQALPHGSTVSVYSEIVSSIVSLDTRHLYHEKRLEAYNAAEEMKQLWTYQLLFVIYKLQSWMGREDMQTKIQKQFPFDQLAQAIVHSATGNKSDGKVQVVVNSSLMEE